MIFGIYTGEIARNASVNLTRHGTFEAPTVAAAIARIEFNIKHRYYDRWRIPERARAEIWDENMNWALRFGMFVCEGDPFVRNVIWRDRNAVVSYHDACRGERSRGAVKPT